MSGQFYIQQCRTALLQFYLGGRCEDLNLKPFSCKESALPLSYSVQTFNEGKPGGLEPPPLPVPGSALPLSYGFRSSKCSLRFLRIKVPQFPSDGLKFLTFVVKIAALFVLANGLKFKLKAFPANTTVG